MNKETIYIEPSDDITDILSRVKASEKKIIALVPPKKPAVLLSSVNVKLIARAAKAGKKTIVLVTTNDALTKLAMTANLPVAPSLKSRPIMPGEENLVKIEDKSSDETDDEEPDETSDEPADEGNGADEDDLDSDETDSEEKEPDEDDDTDEDDGEDEDEEDDKDDEEEDKAEKKINKLKEKLAAKKTTKKASKQEEEPSNAALAFIAKYKIWFIIGAVSIVALIAFLIWALTIAPRVNVSVSVRTTSANFSENVIFTKNSSDEDSSTGTFSLHEETLEKDQVVKFTATGKKDMGEHATGSLVAYYQSKDAFSFAFSAGSKFAYKGFEYTANSATTLAWDGEDDSACESGSSISKGCLKSVAIAVTAVAPGEDYNVSGQQSGWGSGEFPSVAVYNSEDIAGGTSRIVTVVQQSDIDFALDKLKSESSAGSKEELYDKISDTAMPVEASFKVVTSDPKATPAVGEEVKEGVTPQVSTKTTYSIFTIDQVRVEEFIKTKASLEEGKRLYSIGEPFIEYFAEGSNGVYTGKLKTTYKVGPEISETEILDKIRGEKIGRIEPILKDAFAGISSVKIEKSYFWVNSVPNDENKVQIQLTIEE